MKSLLIALAAIIIPVSASASVANLPIDQNLTAHVGYHDLDLTSDLGRDVLIGRIKVAASRVCDPDDFNYPYRPARTCFRVAVAGGMKQMESILPATARSERRN